MSNEIFSQDHGKVSRYSLVLYLSKYVLQLDVGLTSTAWLPVKTWRFVKKSIFRSCLTQNCEKSSRVPQNETRPKQLLKSYNFRFWNIFNPKNSGLYEFFGICVLGCVYCWNWCLPKSLFKILLICFNVI